IRNGIFEKGTGIGIDHRSVSTPFVIQQVEHVKDICPEIKLLLFIDADTFSDAHIPHKTPGHSYCHLRSHRY
ncbi:hypothetical protein FCL43_022755, partial [Enterobacter hormaechei]|nr:hypothetical protein [Enterobacter hormaechei]